MNNGLRRGNVFISIVAVLGILIFIATSFMDVTRQEKQQTERSHYSTQSQCLAEAALERALTIMQKELNNPEKFREAGHPASWLRAPMPPKTSAGFSSEMGTDSELDASQFAAPVILTKADLEGDNGNQLTELVNFMIATGTEFDVEVRMELDKAFAITPESGSDYLVPGVQIPWNCHSGVKDFFNNLGYVALTLALPETIKWLEFTLTFDIMGVQIFSIELVNLLQRFSDACGFTGISEVLSWSSIHTLLLNVLPDSIYPYQIRFDSDIFPSLSAKTALTLPSEIDRNKAVEKYGILNITARAEINTPNQGKVTKTIFASKEFKCADVEPPAPMYSFFAANLHDEQIIFNDIGGDFFVNNFANFSSIVGEPAHPEKREFPGLIRVNGTQQMDVNVSFIGNPVGPMTYDNDSMVRRVARGAEWLLILSNRIKAVFISGNNYTEVTKQEPKYVDTVTQVPASAKGSPPANRPAAPAPVAGAQPIPAPPADTSGVRNVMSGGVSSVMGHLNQIFSSAVRVNLIPNSTNYGINIFELPLHFLGADVLGGSVGGGAVRIIDPMVKWEWPMAGIGYRFFRVPVPTPSKTVTHFFGDSAMFPTLTREVEGYVLKNYRQWHFCIVSYPPAPIPLGNQIPTPWGIPILPFPLPLWHTHDIQDKYGYNLGMLGSPKNRSGEVDVCTNMYDPAFMENSPPNLYAPEQYIKKAVYYYATAQDFYDDIPNRIIEVNGKNCLHLNGMTYVADSIELPPPESTEFSEGTFYVFGRGGIVCGGNAIMNGHVRQPFEPEAEREAGTPRTVFSLIVRKGGLIVNETPENAVFEGSLYTDKGIAVSADKSIRIVGNWVTNRFSKADTPGDIRIEYVAYKTRSSLNSVNPSTGVYDPERYVVSMAPGYVSVRVQ